MNEPNDTTAPAQEPFNGMLMALSVVARILCVLLGTMAGFSLAVDGTLMPTLLAGICAFAAALIPPSRAGANDHRSLIIIVLAVLGIFFQVADIVVYFRQNNFSGEHYWWSGAMAYFAGLTLMAVYGFVTLSRSKRPGSVQN